MAPKQAASPPNAPKRQKRPIFALWRPRRGNTRARDTQTRSEPDKRLPRHPARLVAPQNRGDARAGVGASSRARTSSVSSAQACPTGAGTKKTPPEGIRTASFTSSNCPRGKTVCLDKAARRVGADREDCKHKKPLSEKAEGRTRWNFSMLEPPRPFAALKNWQLAVCQQPLQTCIGCAKSTSDLLRQNSSPAQTTQV